MYLVYNEDDENVFKLQKEFLIAR